MTPTDPYQPYLANKSLNVDAEPNACLATHTPHSSPQKGALVVITDTVGKVRIIVVDKFTRISTTETADYGVIFGRDPSIDFDLLLANGPNFEGILLFSDEKALANGLARYPISKTSILVRDYFTYLQTAQIHLPNTLPAAIVKLVQSFMS